MSENRNLGLNSKNKVTIANVCQQLFQRLSHLKNRITFLSICLFLTTTLSSQTAASEPTVAGRFTILVQLLLLFLSILSIFSVIPIILCVKRAGKINRSKVAWGFLGFFFSYIIIEKKLLN